jgi:hypothetical protein
MMSRKDDKMVKGKQHVPLRQNAEARKRGRGLKVVYDA